MKRFDNQNIGVFEELDITEKLSIPIFTQTELNELDQLNSNVNGNIIFNSTTNEMLSYYNNQWNVIHTGDIQTTDISANNITAIQKLNLPVYTTPNLPDVNTQNNGSMVYDSTNNKFYGVATSLIYTPIVINSTNCQLKTLNTNRNIQFGTYSGINLFVQALQTALVGIMDVQFSMVSYKFRFKSLTGNNDTLIFNTTENILTNPIELNNNALAPILGFNINSNNVQGIEFNNAPFQSTLYNFGKSYIEFSSSMLPPSNYWTIVNNNDLLNGTIGKVLVNTTALGNSSFQCFSARIENLSSGFVKSNNNGELSSSTVKISDLVIDGNLNMGNYFAQSNNAPISGFDLGNKNYINSEDEKKWTKNGDFVNSDTSIGTNNDYDLILKRNNTDMIVLKNNSVEFKNIVDAKTHLVKSSAIPSSSEDLINISYLTSNYYNKSTSDYNLGFKLNIADASSNYVQKAGSTMTGNLNLSNLIASLPLKLDASKNITSTLLNTSDITGLDLLFDNINTNSVQVYPKSRVLPTYNYTGTTYNVNSEASLNSAITSAVTNDIINVTADIVLSNTVTLNKSVLLKGSTKATKISCSAQTTTLIVSVDNVLISNITIENSNAGSTAITINFSSTTASNNYVDNCVINTNEFGITTINAQIQISNNTFAFVGTADSHRYINLLKTTGTTIFDNNVFGGNGINSTQCVSDVNATGSNFNNGQIAFLNNTSNVSAVQRLFMNDGTDLSGTNVKYYFVNNNMTCSSGFAIFFRNPCLNGVSEIYLSGNTEVLGGTATGSKGLIGLDNSVAGSISNNCKIFAGRNNIIPALRVDYLDLTLQSNKLVAYNSAIFTPNFKIDTTTRNLSVAGDTSINGNLNMNTINKIINLAEPSNSQDGATKNYVDSGLSTKANISDVSNNFVKKAGDTMSGILDMSNNKITTTYVPVNNVDLTNKLYVDNGLSTKANISDVSNNFVTKGGDAGALTVGSNNNSLTLIGNNLARVFIDGSGNMAIGANNSPAGLRCQFQNMDNNGGTRKLCIAESSGLNGNQMFLYSTSGVSYLDSYNSATTTASNLILNTSGGNIGIGRTPTYKLDVSGTTYIRGKDANSVSQYIDSDNNDRRMALYTDGSNNFAGINAYNYFSSSSMPLILNISGGNVGIGKNNPGYTLDVSGVINTKSDIILDGSNFPFIRCKYSNTDQVIYGYNSVLNAGYMGSSTSIPIIIQTNSSEKMRITSAGNVGIGTINPAYKLNVKSDDLILASFRPVTTASVTSTLIEVGCGADNSDKALYLGMENSQLCIGVRALGQIMKIRDQHSMAIGASYATSASYNLVTGSISCSSLVINGSPISQVSSFAGGYAIYSTSTDAYVTTNGKNNVDYVYNYQAGIYGIRFLNDYSTNPVLAVKINVTPHNTDGTNTNDITIPVVIKINPTAFTYLAGRPLAHAIVRFYTAGSAPVLVNAGFDFNVTY